VTDFDRDPAALAWARTKVQEYLDRLGDFERQATEQGDPITRHGCEVARHLAERHFIGDGGCVIGAFDERLPSIGQRDEGGPSVAECADNDRRWDLQREGE
jgi:hypothetical protein